MKKVMLLAVSLISCYAYAQTLVKKAPEVKEGDGPFTQLIIRGVTLIDGTGAPPIGPVYLGSRPMASRTRWQRNQAVLYVTPSIRCT